MFLKALSNIITKALLMSTSGWYDSGKSLLAVLAAGGERGHISISLLLHCH